MSHFPDDNTSELDYPVYEMFRRDKPPIIVSADKGWVTSNNEVVLLRGNVYLYENDEFGERKLEIFTEDARILIDQNYAETDKPATVIGRTKVINSIGLRAYLQEERVEFLHNVRTTITPKDAP